VILRKAPEQSAAHNVLNVDSKEECVLDSQPSLVVAFTTPVWFRYREDSDNVRHALAFGTSARGYLVARRARKDGADETPYIANWREIEGHRVVEFPSGVPDRYLPLADQGVHLNA
jgi:hypothetical protein